MNPHLYSYVRSCGKHVMRAKPHSIGADFALVRLYRRGPRPRLPLLHHRLRAEAK